MKLQHRAEFLFGSWRVVVIQEDGASAMVIGQKYASFRAAQAEADRLNGIETDGTIILLALAATFVLAVGLIAVLVVA